MKIRIKGNYIRIRLEKEEPNLLIEQGSLSNKTQILDKVLEFNISLNKDNSCSLSNSNVIEISVQEQLAKDWLQGEDVCLVNYDEDGLKVEIERDLDYCPPR